MRTKKAKFTVLLPATPCTPEMKEVMQNIAKEKEVSIASLQREAYSLFLSRNVSKANKDDGFAHESAETEMEPVQ